MKTQFHLKTILILALVVLLGSNQNTAQNVGIGAESFTPDASAGLEIKFTDKGLLPPRLTTAERDGIQNPAEGLQIYNYTTKCIEVFIPPNWQKVFCGCSSAPTDLSYTDNGPIVYCLNNAITPNIASTQSASPNSYTVFPALPADLILNSITGEISGTPTVQKAATPYTIIASNACGSVSQVLNIEVLTTPSAPLQITGSSTPTVSATESYSIIPVSGVDSYNWIVPSGWTITSGQGTNNISVTVGVNSGEISVIAINACGTSAPATLAVNTWQSISATGGTITDYTADGSNGVNGVQYRVHRFTTVGNSSLDVTNPGTDSIVDYLIVGGGGGGGGGTSNPGNGGGGGAGGLISGTQYFVANGSYPVTVGAGGSGGNNSYGGNGGNSIFNIHTAIGGGGGGSYGNGNGRNGGSGGGAPQWTSGIQHPGNGTFGQGNNGGALGSTANSDVGGGGGGGAGQVGGSTYGNTSQEGGTGGAGLVNSIIGVATTYAGGGGGSTHNSGSGVALGGTGGGGNGGFISIQPVTGSPNTGGGGGGGGENKAGASGGSGIVIIRYPITNPNP